MDNEMFAILHEYEGLGQFLVKIVDNEQDDNGEDILGLRLTMKLRGVQADYLIYYLNEESLLEAFDALKDKDEAEETAKGIHKMLDDMAQ